MDDSESVLGFLLRSETRRNVLQRLADEGGQGLSTLAAELDVSDRTVRRTLDDTEEREWVESVDSGYALTALGRHVIETYERASDSLAAAATIEPILTRLAGDACDIPVNRVRRRRGHRSDEK